MGIPTGATILGSADPKHSELHEAWLAGNVFDVKNGYDADDTGTTSSSTPIQNAINAAQTAGGGVVLIPHGTYLASGLTLRSGVSIVSDGATLKIPDNTATGAGVFYIFNGETITDVTIKGLKFDGNRTNGNRASETVFGIKLQDTSRIIIEDCYFVNSRAEGVYINRNAGQPDHIRVVNNLFEDCGDETGGTGNPRQGMAVISGQNIIIEGNHFDTIHAFGVDLEANAGTDTFSSVVIANNTFDTCTQGFINVVPTAVANATDITVIGNTGRGTTETPYYVKATGATVVGNSATEATINGAVVLGGTRTTVAGNHLRFTGASGTAGVVLLDSATYCTVVGNTLLGTGAAAGVREGGASDNNYLAANVIEDTIRYTVVGASTWTDVQTRAAFAVGGNLSLSGNNISGSNASGLTIQATGGILDLRSSAENDQIIFYGSDGAAERGRFDASGHFVIKNNLDHDGSNIGFFGVAPAARAAAYTPTNVTADRSYDANATTTDELADVLGTLIADLKTYGLLQ